MLLKNLKETSISISAIRCPCIKFKQGMKILTDISKDSYIHMFTAKLSERIMAWSEYSYSSALIHKITDEPRFNISESSTFIRYLIGLYRSSRIRFNAYLNNTSKLVNFIHESKAEIKSWPFDSLSIIAVIAIITNTVLTIIFKRRIILQDAILSIVFFFLAIAYLSLRLNWQSIKEDSLIFHLFAKKTLHGKDKGIKNHQPA